MAHQFNAALYAAIPAEDVSFITDLRDGAVATYHPANSQELIACERIALAQASLSRCAMLEAGFHTAFLSEFGPLTEAVDAQNLSRSLADGFSRTTGESDAFKLFLRYRDQCRREYRDARQDIVQLIKLRDALDQPASEVAAAPPPVTEDTPLPPLYIPRIYNEPPAGPPLKDLFVLQPRFANRSTGDPIAHQAPEQSAISPVGPLFRE